MANELFCLINYFYRDQKGGSIISYEQTEEKEEEEEEEESKQSIKWWLSLAQACFSIYLIYSYATRTYLLINNNIESLDKLQEIFGLELKEEAGLAVMDVFNDKFEEAQLVSLNPALEGAIKNTHQQVIEQYYLSDKSSMHAVAIPSSSGMELIDNMIPTEADFKTSSLPVLCETFTSCLFDMIKIGAIGIIKEVGYEGYIPGDIIKDIESHNKELRNMISSTSKKITGKIGWTMKEFRDGYPELDKLITKLEEPTNNHIKEALTNIVYGYPAGGWQLSQLFGIMEDIPLDIASKIQDVLRKKTKKLQILTSKMFTNSIEIIGNSKHMLAQSFILAGCIWYLISSKKKQVVRDPHLLYLEDIQKKHKKKKKKSAKKKKKKKSVKKKKKSVKKNKPKRSSFRRPK
jgi:hypothetical protein